MSDNKNDTSELYDENFLKEKEEFMKSFDSLRDSEKEKQEDSYPAEYDIFELDKFGAEDEKFSKKGLKKKFKAAKKKEEKKPAAEKAAARAKKSVTAEMPSYLDKPFKVHKPVERVEITEENHIPITKTDSVADLDELLKNLGIISAAEKAIAEGSAARDDEAQEDVRVYSPEGRQQETEAQQEPEAREKTMHFDIPENQDKTAENTQYFVVAESQPEKKETDLGHTRHFNIKEYLKKAQKSQGDSAKKKSFRKGFRVLDNKNSDEAILEASPTGEGMDSMMDALDTKQGQDLFEAVENARQEQDNASTDESRSRLQALEQYRDRIAKRLSGEKKELIALAALGVAAFVLFLLEGFYKQGGALEPIFAKGGIIYGLINLVIFGLAAAVVRKELIAGVKGIRYANPDKNTVMVVIGFFLIVYDLIHMIKGTIGTLSPAYTLCFVFAAFIRYMSLYMEDFSAVSAAGMIIRNDGECEGIHIVDSKHDALAIAHGLAGEEKPTVLYGAYSKADSFVKERELPRKTEERFYSISCMAVIIVCFLLSVVTLVTKADTNIFFRVLISGICMCLPVSADFLEKVLFMTENRKVLPYGGYINDYSAIDEVGKANAVVCQSEDLFSCEVSRFRRVGGASVSKGDSAVFAAIALKAGGSMLGECFDDFIESLGIELPEAESIQYEEKLGFSCWILERRVLVGNREMLLQHSIEAPTEEEERNYGGKKFVMYVVVEGELVATFLAQYKTKKSFRRIAGEFSKTGFALLINSKEPCLTEDNTAERLSVETATIKIISNKAIGVVREYEKYPAKGRGTSLICLKKKNGILPLAVTVRNFYSISRIADILSIAGQGLGLLFVALGAFLNASVLTSPVFVVMFHILWSALAVFSVSEYCRKYFGRLIDRFTKKGGNKK